jgi:hypothetical protein
MVYLISIRALRQRGQKGLKRANTDWGAAGITVRHGDYTAKRIAPDGRPPLGMPPAPPKASSRTGLRQNASSQTARLAEIRAGPVSVMCALRVVSLLSLS